MTTEQKSELEEEIESWKGFPLPLRKEDRELWEAMVQEVGEARADSPNQAPLAKRSLF